MYVNKILEKFTIDREMKKLKPHKFKKKSCNFSILEFYTAHFRQRVAWCVSKHDILQYLAPHVVHVYELRNPQTAQNIRRGKFDEGASIVI